VLVMANKMMCVFLNRAAAAKIFHTWEYTTKIANTGTLRSPNEQRSLVAFSSDGIGLRLSSNLGLGLGLGSGDCGGGV